MTTERLYEFLTLSRTLNYSTAASHLFISQSVLSKHIQDLEKELGTALFSRNTHGVSLTPNGHLFVSEAAALIEECNASLYILQKQNVPTTGEVRVGIAVELSFAAHVQIFLMNFQERYPGIRVYLEVLTQGTPDRFLYDYDILITPCNHQNLGNHVQQCHIHDYGTYVMLCPPHPLLSKSLISLRDLEGETILVPFSTELFGPYAQNYALVNKFTHGRVSCIPTNNLASALFMVSLKKGVAIVPRYAKHMMPANSFLIGISNKECIFPEYLYYRETGENPAASLFYQEFCQWAATAGK